MSRNALFAYMFCGLSLMLLAQSLRSGEGGVGLRRRPRHFKHRP